MTSLATVTNRKKASEHAILFFKGKAYQLKSLLNSLGPHSLNLFCFAQILKFKTSKAFNMSRRQFSRSMHHIFRFCLYKNVKLPHISSNLINKTQATYESPSTYFLFVLFDIPNLASRKKKYKLSYQLRTVPEQSQLKHTAFGSGKSSQKNKFYWSILLLLTNWIVSQYSTI